ncbi:MAG: RNA polymerase sigma factor [Myxococcales bacterium]
MIRWVRRLDPFGCGLNPTVGALEGRGGGDDALVGSLDRPYSRLSRDWVDDSATGQPPNPPVVVAGAPVEAAASVVSAAASADQLVPPVGTGAAEDGSWLVERFIAGLPAAEPEICLQLNRLLHRVFEQRWSRQKLSYFEVRGDCFILLAHLREVGKLRVEPLSWLAQRLMKQCARQQLRDRFKDTKLLSLDVAFGADPEDGKAKRLARSRERKASKWYAQETPEQALLGRELFAWLTAAREKLSPTDRSTYDACLELYEGKGGSLHAALGIKEDAAWQRRSRMRAAIAELAHQDGMSQVVDRWKVGRARRRDRKAEGE